MTAAAETVAVPRNIKPGSPVQNLARIRGPFSLRCGAILIDYIVLVAILAFSTLVSRLLGGGARTAGSSSLTVGIVLTLLLAALDLGILPGLTGMTIGKWATGLRIRRSNGMELGIGRAFLRHFVGYPLSALTLGLGFIFAACNARGRALHDLIAGTIVVREGSVIVENRRRRA
jgi:uncharacterized RDD family membrane protein YckC